MNNSSSLALQPAKTPLDASVMIVGAGFSGLAMAIALKKAGIDFIILEKGSEVGGTWRDNVYPGAACDVPSHMYCYSFEPKRWTRSFAAQEEIWDYTKTVAQKYDLYPHLRFGVEVKGAAYDDAQNIWRVDSASGQSFHARVVISARGALHIPAFPNIAGLSDFKGIKMHSAQWDKSIDLTGKRVAVIGTGASAIQVVPQMAKIAGKLYVFQRTPAWVIPKADFAFKESTKDKYDNSRLARLWYRNKIYWLLEANAAGFVLDPRLMKFGQKLAYKNLNKVKDDATRQALTPTYTMGCKRVLLSNNYYPAFNQDNVHLIGGGVSEVKANSVVANGQECEVDAIIFCTGFDVTNQANQFGITGKQGKSIHDHWKDGMHAYLGISSYDFPNAFFLLGPNTGLGHNSIIFMIESQAKYIAQAVTYMKKQQLAKLEVRREAEEGFIAEMQQQSDKSVWKSGCNSWYLDDNGRNTTLWPSFTFMYWLKTRAFDPAKYVADKKLPKLNPIKRLLAKV
jgi:cation diffusion facilitator CzcD-associated flavoprotein CzcO